MDPISITGFVLSIVTLYSACRDCYIFFTDVKSAEKDSLIHLRELGVQQSILKAWGFYWEIQRHDTIAGGKSKDDKNNRKLRRYLETNIYKADGVLSALCAISDALSNQHKLIKRYGLSLNSTKGNINKQSETDVLELSVHGSTAPSAIQITAATVRQRLSVITKCRWAIKDRESFKKLTTDLKSYNDALYRLCPDGAFEAMNIHLTLECLSQQNSYVGLRKTFKLASQLIENGQQSASRDGLQMLASAAEFKANSIKFQKARNLPVDLRMVSPAGLRELRWSLVVLDNKVVYVERKSYREEPGSHSHVRRSQSRRPKPRREISRERASGAFDRTGRPIDIDTSRRADIIVQERDVKVERDGVSIERIICKDDPTDDSEDEREDYETREVIPDWPVRENILRLCCTLQNVDGWQNFMSLKPIGIVDYEKGSFKYHVGLIHELPGDLGKVSGSAPAEDIKLRRPRPLTHLLHHSQSVLLVPLGSRFDLTRKLFDAVVFLHASGWLHKNIKTSSLIVFPKSGKDGETMDLEHLYLARYNFSRPDDVREDRVDNKAARTGFFRREARTEREREINLDYYHHPDKLASPKRRYRHAYDVYSVGIVLLEIGLWSRLDDFLNDAPTSHSYDNPDLWEITPRALPKDPYDLRREIIAQCLDPLRFHCGDAYANVVHKCLMVNTSDSEICKANQRELCARIAADLSECRA